VLKVVVEDKPDEKECEGTSKVSSKELSSLKEKLDTKTAQLLRLAADFDNFKKRQRRDTQLQVQNFAEKLMKGLLPVLDSMDRAKETVDDGEDNEHLREGFVQLFNQFHKAHGDAGVNCMDVLGQPFDPRYHEALMHHPSEGVEPGCITVELQKGWIMGERVLRAARVGVAPDAPAEVVPPEADELQPELEIEVEGDVCDDEPILDSVEPESVDVDEETVDVDETENSDKEENCDGAEGDCDGADEDSETINGDCDDASNASDESPANDEDDDEPVDTEIKGSN